VNWVVPVSAAAEWHTLQADSVVEDWVKVRVDSAPAI
jgi:hypothetical protein